MRSHLRILSGSKLSRRSSSQKEMYPIFFGAHIQKLSKIGSQNWSKNVSKNVPKNVTKNVSKNRSNFAKNAIQKPIQKPIQKKTEKISL